jgi:hypothetical protein
MKKKNTVLLSVYKTRKDEMNYKEPVVRSWNAKENGVVTCSFREHRNAA